MNGHTEENKHYIIGDLLWAKIGHYPFWPCMVSYDPYEGQYFKLKKVRYGEERIYHVQYFGKQVQHGWTKTGKILPFKGEENFNAIKKNLLETATAGAKKRVNLLYGVPAHIMKVWRNAVQEATSALSVNPLLRFETFVFKYETKTSALSKYSPVPKSWLDLKQNNKGEILDSVLAEQYGCRRCAVVLIKLSYKEIIQYDICKGDKKLVLSTKQPLKSSRGPLKLKDGILCKLCEKINANINCAGDCSSYFHKECLGLLRVPRGFKCIFCDQGKTDKYAGGNLYCPRPTPPWQKPITSFFSSNGSANETNGKHEPMEAVPSCCDDREPVPGCSTDCVPDPCPSKDKQQPAAEAEVDGEEPDAEEASEGDEPVTGANMEEVREPASNITNDDQANLPQFKVNS